MRLTKNSHKTIKPEFASLFLVAMIVIAALIVSLWVVGLEQIQAIFVYLNQLQEHPPMWVEVPMVMTRFLVLPTIFVFILVLIITNVSPKPRAWSRFVVISIL
ncbi:MAG: cellulose synthase catalytic subunit, partial [Waterburya sp.]